LYILGAALMFALMNLFVRLAGDLPVMQKVFFRNLFAAIIMFIVLCFDKQKFRIKSKECFFWLFMRALLGFLGVILNFYAIDRLNISDASILNKLSPFFAIVFSIFLLKEKPKFMEVLFVVIAFIGAMFVVKPTFGVEALPALSGFASGACAGFAYTCVRILGIKGERGVMTIFFFSAFSTIVALPFFIAFYEPMSWLQLVYLLLAGLSATGGQFFITAAYRKAPAKEIAVFDYSQVLFAALLGFFFLEQLPDIFSIIGYIIIIGAAVSKWLYHLKKHAHATEPPLQTDEQPQEETDETQPENNDTSQ
ncbi:MAG: DMT family transporter, partial [Clostridiales bacterium]|nr:DMT family transporter [Clostridiales bacterium]